MDIAKYKANADETVIAPMMEFLECDECDDDCGYTAKDVEKCRKLIYGYLDALGAMEAADDSAIMQQVKKLVLALNRLNEKTDFALIETDAREALWELIQSSAIERGLKSASDDITEEWRDW